MRMTLRVVNTPPTVPERVSKARVTTSPSNPLTRWAPVRCRSAIASSGVVSSSPRAARFSTTRRAQPYASSSSRGACSARLASWATASGTSTIAPTTRSASRARTTMAMAIPRGMTLLKYFTGNERTSATAIPVSSSLGRVGAFQKMRRISPATIASKILRVRGETGMWVNSACISGLSRQANLRPSQVPGFERGDVCATLPRPATIALETTAKIAAKGPLIRTPGPVVTRPERPAPSETDGDRPGTVRPWRTAARTAPRRWPGPS